MNTEELLADEHCIGLFGDERLCKSGMLFLKRMIERSTVCVRQLSDERAEQKRIYRFLKHPNVTRQEIIRHGSERSEAEQLCINFITIVTPITNSYK